MKTRCGVKYLAGLALAMFLSNSLMALAIEVGGVTMQDTVRLADQNLKLNGAGLRVKVFFKVYALGLYLPEKKSSSAEILSLPGPRRIDIVMLRNVSSEDFSEAFISNLNANSSKTERSAFSSQIIELNAMFDSIHGLKAGDVLTLDWLPDVGMQCQLNGKAIGKALQSLPFYNAVLKIWIGNKPVDNALKSRLLGNMD